MSERAGSTRAAIGCEIHPVRYFEVAEHGGDSMNAKSIWSMKTTPSSAMGRKLRPQTFLLCAAMSGALGLAANLAHAAGEPAVEADPVSRVFYVQDIKAAVTRHIEGAVDPQGVFLMRDDKTGETLPLKFVQVHDPVRQIGSDVYFACTDFHVLGKPEKLYDIDFWMREDTGELKVYESKVHKEPRWSLVYGWYKQPRYTFVDDKIKYLY